MSMPMELWHPDTRARAFEAIRLRLDETTPLARRAWPVIAAQLSYPSGDACRRSVWRLVNRLQRSPELAPFVTALTRAVNLPASADTPDWLMVRRALRELDRERMPADNEPRPAKRRPLSDAAARRIAKAWVAELARTVDADPDPRALVRAGSYPPAYVDIDAAADSKGTE